MSSAIHRLSQNKYKPKYIFDIGAYHGNWTSDIINIYKDAKYYLFEAIDYSELDILKDNYKNTQLNIFKNTILYDSVQLVDFYEERNTGDSIHKELSYHFQDTLPIKRQTNTINNIFKNNINELSNILIKIDTQGS